MSEIDNTEVETAEETEESPEETEDTEETEETTEETSEEKKPKETPEQKEARLERQLAKVRKVLGKESKEEKKAPEPKKKSGLDDTVLDYLDLKGVSESEDIKVIEAIMEKTGMSAREALKDEYVSMKLKANKEAREVKNATPSSTKRAGETKVGVAAAIAKFESTGVLPEDFELRSAVVDALESKTGSNVPNWHRK